MSSSSDTLRFCFPARGDSILSKMNALREERRFCDVTLLLEGARGARPLRFPCHRVVLAASSDFLRDQFLLHGGWAELSVGVVSNVEVGNRLLLSCYTGFLEVPLRELVSYLTVASALQMSHVVEKCAQALSQYLNPMLALMKVDRDSEERTIQQPDCRKNQEERKSARPSTNIREANTKKVELHHQGLKKVRDDGSVAEGQIELSEDGCGLESEGVGEVQPVRQQDHHVEGTSSSEPCLQTAVRAHKSSPTSRSCSPRGQNKAAGEEQKEEEEMLLLAAQLQECRPLMKSKHFGAHLPKSQSSGDEMTSSMLAPRPYLCRKCDRVFQHLESYVGHLKDHRRFLCLVCGEGFSQKSHLMHHIHAHTGIKPFRCPLCHKLFSQKSMLQDHLNLHTGYRPHKCSRCAAHFAHKPGLRRHLKDIHGNSGV